MEDGSRVCDFNAQGLNFVFDTSVKMEFRAPDAIPKYIVERFTGEVFDVNLMTLIHLGAENIRLYSTDLNVIAKKSLFYIRMRPSK